MHNLPYVPLRRATLPSRTSAMASCLSASSTSTWRWQMCPASGRTWSQCWPRRRRTPKLVLASTAGWKGLLLRHLAHLTSTVFNWNKRMFHWTQMLLKKKKQSVQFALTSRGLVSLWQSWDASTSSTALVYPCGSGRVTSLARFAGMRFTRRFRRNQVSVLGMEIIMYACWGYLASVALCTKSNGSYDIKDFSTLSLIFSTSEYLRLKLLLCPSFFCIQIFQINEKGSI